MSFIETPRFPESISAGSKFGPGYSTTKAQNIGGYVAVNKNWTYPLHEGDVSSGVKSQADIDDLLAFFHGVAGMFNGFRFKDWKDYQVTGSQGTLISLGGNTWQMCKTYTFGALTAVRKISKPLAGATIAGGGVYSYSTTTGIITKSSGSNPSSWTGEFDVPVMFDLDQMLPVWVSYQNYDYGSIPVKEVRI